MTKNKSNGTGLSLAEEAYIRLRKSIMQGEIPAGSALKESELAKKLKTSRTPIREAMRRLKSDGLLSIQQGGGAWVRVVSFRDVVEMYEIRWLVEPYAARSASTSLNPGFADRMQLTRANLLEYPLPQEASKRWEMDRQLHDLILEASGNAMLRELIWNLRVRTETAFIYLANRGLEATRNEHLQLIDAIFSGDADRAESVMREHITNSRARLTQNVTEPML